MVIDAVLWRTRTGTPWRDLPEEYGNWKTVYNRHRRWAIDGVWATILDELQRGCAQADGPDWTVAVDGTVVRAHQHAAGARHQPPAELQAAASWRSARPHREGGRLARADDLAPRGDDQDRPRRRALAFLTVPSTTHSNAGKGALPAINAGKAPFPASRPPCGRLAALTRRGDGAPGGAGRALRLTGQPGSAVGRGGARRPARRLRCGCGRAASRGCWRRGCGRSSR